MHTRILYTCIYIYCRRGTIRWAKHLWFQSYEVFRKNTFMMHWPLVFITYLWLKIQGKAFAVAQNRESLAQRIFTVLPKILV